MVFPHMLTDSQIRTFVIYRVFRSFVRRVFRSAWRLTRAHSEIFFFFFCLHSELLFHSYVVYIYPPPPFPPFFNLNYVCFLLYYFLNLKYLPLFWHRNIFLYEFAAFSMFFFFFFIRPFFISFSLVNH